MRLGDILMWHTYAGSWNVGLLVKELGNGAFTAKVWHDGKLISDTARVTTNHRAVVTHIGNIEEIPDDE